MFKMLKKKLKQREGKNVKFEKGADEWLEYKKGKIKESTYCEYMRIIEKNLKPYFGKMNIMDITNINGYVQQLSQKFSTKTVRCTVNILKSIIEYYEEEYDCNVKLRRICLPKPMKVPVEIFTKRERTKLEHYCLHSEDIKTIGVVIALNTGMRIGEICGLQWKDIDLFEKRIYVSKTAERIHNIRDKKSKVIVTTPKTSTSNRIIPISSKLCEFLKPLKKKYDDNAFVLSGTSKIIEPRVYQNTFSKILQINKIKHRKFHCLRHTFATNCIEVGMDAKSLSEILGHANVNITLAIYVHSSEKIKKKYLEKL